jgi:hypothetical protein
MMMNSSFKKVVVTGLTAAMVLGGSTAAFAKDDKGKINDNRGRGVNNAVQNKLNWTNWNNKDNKGAAVNINNVQNLTIKMYFDDVKGGDVEWATRYIASLASKRVFEGYEDGTFQPRKTITRIEAITAAVRLMGLRDQAESAEAKAANLNFKDADKLKSKYSWATGYVSVALQNDLFEESDDSINPEKEADRLWATTLLIKALKLQDEAKAKMNTKLTFKDANKIPAGSVGYIALALEKGLIDGYEDNTFRPNNPVTRAELAALLDRTGNQLPDNTSVSGTVNAAVSSNVLSLTVEGQTGTVEIDSQAYILRNGLKVAPSELRIGDEVLVRTFNGKAIFIEVTKLGNGTGTGSQLPENTNFTATINTLVSNNTVYFTKDGQSYTVPLDSSVTIVRNGATVPASELRVGDVASVRVSGGKVILITVTTPANQADFVVNGTFNSYTTNSDGSIYQISINKTLSDGTVQNNVYYNTTSNVTFLYQTSNGTIQGDRSQLSPNRTVELRGSNSIVHTIVIK